MAKLIVRHKVQDYATWRAGFDGHASARNEAGCIGAQVFQSASDPNEVTAIMEWKSVEAAQAFTASPSLKEAMMKAGVTSQPDISFLVEA